MKEESQSKDEATLDSNDMELEVSHGPVTTLSDIWERLEQPEQRLQALSVLQKLTKTNPGELKELLTPLPDQSRNLLKIQLELGIGSSENPTSEKAKALGEKLISLLTTMGDSSM